MSSVLGFVEAEQDLCWFAAILFDCEQFKIVVFTDFDELQLPVL